jgi:tetratricopeptide (TPR) repeat protein
MTYRELVVAAILVAARPASADEPARDPQLDRRLAERLTLLADHHYRAGAYYRAISAYEELALFTTDDAVRQLAAIRIAMSYHHGHQLDDALAAYRAALALPLDPPTAQAVRIQLALARVERSFEAPGAEPFDAIAAELAPSAAAGPHRALALVQLARIEGLAGRPAAAAAHAAALHAACLQPGPACDLAPALDRALAAPPPPRRSPWLGVALSLAVPGAGSVYGGHLVDGLYYFALTGATGLGALDVHDGQRGWRDQKATFWGLAILAATFYAGGALGGYVAVARTNELAALAARHALWDATAAPWPLER